MRRRMFLAGLAIVLLGGFVALQVLVRDRQYRQLLAEGNAAIRDGQPFLAIEAFSGAVALRPDSMLAHLRRAEAYRLRGDLDAATRDLRRASLLDPSAVRPLDDLADVLAARQRFRRAADVYEARLRIDERSPATLYKLALVRYSAGDAQGALSAAGRAQVLDDAVPEVHYLEALSLRQLGRLDDASAALTRTLALAPGLSAAREELASVYRALDRPIDEIEQLQILAGLDHDSAARQIALAHALAHAGDVPAAVATLTRALERSPDDRVIIGALGQVWLDAAASTDEPAALAHALTALERASATTAAPSSILAAYGRALTRDGQFERAEQALRRATEQFPVEPAAFLEYANVAERLGRRADARSALLRYDALIEDDPARPARALRVAALSLDLGEIGPAEEWLKRAAAMPLDDDAQLQIERLRARVNTLTSRAAATSSQGGRQRSAAAQLGRSAVR